MVKNITKTCPCIEYPTPRTPLLYSNTGVCMGIPISLIFASKYRLWVLVRTASPTKKIRKISKFSAENAQFLKLKNLCILHGQVFVIRSGLANI